MKKEIRIVYHVPWENAVNRETVVGKYRVLISTNKWDPNTNFVIDVGVPYSSLSAMARPEQRIYISCEPTPYVDISPSKMDYYYKKMMLTWYPQLQKFKQTVNFTKSSYWVNGGFEIDDKVFGISGLVSSKNGLRFPGYAIRNRILELELEFSIPSMVWNYRGKWQGVPHEYPMNPKDKAMQYMFHLAIENCSENGYHTEKIMDCFRTYSIPLYYGDPKIENVFNMKGIIVLDKNDLMGQINSLSKDAYYERIPALLDNFQRAEVIADDNREIAAILEI